jgi:pimeloyl-ACP methyl ester carboxylesterase
MFTRRSMTLGLLGTGLLASSLSSARALCPVGAGEPVHEKVYVPIGGINQWVQIMGADRRNPVLLILNGGPGSTWDPFTDLFRDWEKHFTMVYWDQRGAGKTYRKTGESITPTMTIERMVDDGIEVAEYLRQHVGARRILVLGHSWGTLLGVMMAQKRPELFSAYIGTGQFTNFTRGELAGYRETQRRAMAAGRDDAVKALRELGEPPYDDIQKLVAERKWAGTFDTPSDAAFDAAWHNPDWFSKADNSERFKAFIFSNTVMYGKALDGPATKVDLVQSARGFRVPVIIIQGDRDHITPPELVQDYARIMTAPHKALVMLPGGGHNAVFAMKDKFLAALLQQLGPLAC